MVQYPLGSDQHHPTSNELNVPDLKSDLAMRVPSIATNYDHKISFIEYRRIKATGIEGIEETLIAMSDCQPRIPLRD